jgi:hypothetical protein
MSYLNQFERVKRYLAKVNPSTKYHGNQIEYEDNLWSFFQNAWHLKDWIKNDSAIIKIPIEKIIGKYNSLKICADMANRTKHFQLTTANRLDAKHIRTDVTVKLPVNLNDILTSTEKPYPIIKASGSTYNYVIEDKYGNTYEAIGLANEIVEDWKNIISKHIINK